MGRPLAPLITQAAATGWVLYARVRVPDVSQQANSSTSVIYGNGSSECDYESCVSHWPHDVASYGGAPLRHTLALYGM